MRIVHIAAEFAPLIKVGGLGEVLGGLSVALKKAGQDVSVILPKYSHLQLDLIKNLKLEARKFKIFEKSRWQRCNIYSGHLDNIKIYLIDPVKKYFNRKKVYGYKDDIARFLFFSKAALELIYELNIEIDVLHLHDWHTAFIAPLQKELYINKTKIKSIVLSIHNLQYQGHCRKKDIVNLNLQDISFLKDKKLQDPIKPKTLNLLKGGLIYSDFIIPVSDNYAKEILTKKHGCNLSSVLIKHKRKIKGILNGIDEKYWNPKIDKNLKFRFSDKTSLKKLKQIKSELKNHLRKKLKLSNKNFPIIANIGRLVQQKGPKLIKHSILSSIKKDAQFILLGTPYDKETSKMFHKLKKDLKNNKNAFLDFNYNEKLSHEIFASCDFIIVPSFFEPCGLTQLIAFKYGAIPIVRQTGGLADTVFDLDDKTIKKSIRNGFTFKAFSIKGVDSAIDRALKFWYNDEDNFYKQIHKNLSLDFTWKKSANKYIQIYKKLI